MKLLKHYIIVLVTKSKSPCDPSAELKDLTVYLEAGTQGEFANDVAALSGMDIAAISELNDRA